MLLFFLFFFFNDTATTEIYTLSLHDALPICRSGPAPDRRAAPGPWPRPGRAFCVSLSWRGLSSWFFHCRQRSLPGSSLAYRHTVHPPRCGVVVIDRVVLRGQVVPDGHRALAPAKAHLPFRHLGQAAEHGHQG